MLRNALNTAIFGRRRGRRNLPKYEQAPTDNGSSPSELRKLSAYSQIDGESNSYGAMVEDGGLLDGNRNDSISSTYLQVPPAWTPPPHGGMKKSLSTSVYMSDGQKPIDFVLAYQPIVTSGSKALLHPEYRIQFERKLKQQGLMLEYEGLDQSQDGKTCFVKIHAPWDVLTRTAEINRVKMPIKMSDLEREDRTDRWIERIFKRNPFKIEEGLSIAEKEYFTAAFSRDRMHQFLIADKDTFFSQTQRIRMVWDLILRITIPMQDKFGQFNGEPVGIKFLLKEGVYVAAFPLHDGDYKEDPCDGAPPGKWPLRRWLFTTWTIPSRWYKYQPLSQIRNYFGEKVAIYFAWIGFYTLPAIVGFFCFVYGLSSHNFDIPRQDICERYGNQTVCRLCANTMCPYTPLRSSCLYATLTYIFDNSATVFYAFFMSIWAVVFLELWKRQQHELMFEWDVRDLEFTEDNIRPEYQASVKTKRINPVTQEEEPYLPIKNKVQRVFASAATVMFMLFVVMGILAAIIFYRIVGSGLYYKLKDPLINEVSAPMLTSVTAAAINAVCILAVGYLYEKLAWWLTNREFPRTETEFENSYTYKVFIFQFINYYAALFYIAFIKGKIFGPPDSKGYVDRCDPIGCLIDVCIQLAIIMIVKQLLTNFVEVGYPMLLNWWKRRNNIAETDDNKYTRWEKDFDLEPLPELGLFEEYLEMIIQYGFVTMFVAAFPLAPLFALLNNILEIRLDGYKLLTQFRRPVPTRAQNIGAWYPILEVITRIAVITNGLVIAFTSDFVDRMVYVSVYSPDGSLQGYIHHVFSVFNTSVWSREELRTDEKVGNISTCLYRDYRYPPLHRQAYEQTRTWWHVLVGRLFFVLVFEHVVFFIQGIIAYLIPDMPEHVQVKIQRENYLAKQALYQHEFENISPPPSIVTTVLGKERTSQNGPLPPSPPPINEES